MTSADFELPGPVVLERGDVARIIGTDPTASACWGCQRESTRYGQLDVTMRCDACRAKIGLPPITVHTAPPGLTPCPTCNTEQAPRDGHMAVHFATREAVRPCAGSWPAKVRR